MATERTITVRAADGKMTVAELRQFLASIGQTADNDATRVNVTTKGIGGIKAISVTLRED